jgi:hypothetical protein
MQFDCQFSSATVTNPGLTPAETNAKLRGYHQKVNPSTVHPQTKEWRPQRLRRGRRSGKHSPRPHPTKGANL